jgi:hypothetical protein
MLFGSKTLKDAHQFGSKALSDIQQFGQKHHIIRKFANTIDTIDKYAQPALGIASTVAPQFAPAIGAISAGISTGKKIGNELRKYD